MMAYINDILNKLIFLSSCFINQTSQTIHSSSSTHLFNELSFPLIWFMNQIERINYWIKSQTIFELDSSLPALLRPDIEFSKQTKKVHWVV